MIDAAGSLADPSDPKSRAVSPLYANLYQPIEARPIRTRLRMIYRGSVSPLRKQEALTCIDRKMLNPSNDNHVITTVVKAFLLTLK
jgi:hypothetical protein